MTTAAPHVHPGDEVGELSSIKQRLLSVPDPLGLLESLFAFCPIGLQIYEATGRCLLINDAFRELFGDPPPDHDLFHDEVARRSGLVDMARRALDGETVHLVLPVEEGVFSFARSDPDHRVDLEATIFPVRDALRKVSHVGLIFDGAPSSSLSDQRNPRSREERTQSLTRERQARDAAETSAEWVRRLQRVTSALSEARTAVDVGEVVVREGVAATGADTVLFYVTSPSSDELELLAHGGVDERWVKDRGRLPLASGFPCSDVLTRREPMFIESGADSAPSLLRALGAVPLLIGQRAVGSICVGFHRDHLFGAEERAFFLTLAQQCAQALDRARLYEAERKARLLAQKNEEWYQLIARATKEVLWDWDVQGGRMTWSDGLERVFGYPDEPGRNRDDWWLLHIHPDDIAGVRASIRSIFVGEGDVWSAEYRVRRANGSFASVIDRGHVTRDERGSPSRVVGAILDVTELRRAEEQVREEARISETLNRIGTNLAAELDLEKLAQQMTDEARALTGAEVGVFFYHAVSDAGEPQLLQVRSGAAPASVGPSQCRALSMFDGTLRSEPTIRVDDIAGRPDYAESAECLGPGEGGLMVRSYLAVPVISRSGETLGGLFFGHSRPGVFTERDERIVSGIAGQAAVSMDNAKLFRQAKQAIEVRDHFVSIASHELNTPLTSLVLQLAILRRGAKTPELMADKLEMMSRQVTRLSKLVSELLDVSRITTGHLNLELEPMELCSMVSDVASRLGDDFAKSGSTLDLSTGGAVVGLWDRLRVDQVITNLLSNALKFGRGRPIHVAVCDRGAIGRITVTDLGIGIAADHQKRIFQRFERAVSDQNYGGFGLGLWIVRQIVEAHGGTIKVESKQGEGSTFTVDLPRKPSPRVPDKKRD